MARNRFFTGRMAIYSGNILWTGRGGREIPVCFGMEGVAIYDGKKI